MTGESVHEEDRLRKTKVDNGGSAADTIPSNLLSSNFLSGNLTQLKLSGSGLSQLPVDLPPSDTIVEVDLSRNRLSELPGSLCSLKNLRFLNLAGNELTKVPEALYLGLHMLKMLNLSGNRLLTFQRAPLCLPLLQTLDLSNNKLVAPPPWLLEDLPSSLAFLDLSNNPCFQLSLRHSQLLDSSIHASKVSGKIKTLHLVNCGLKGAVNEKYISNFKNIEKLDISNNTLGNSGLDNFLPDVTEIPGTIEELSLSGVGLASLPKTITGLSQLRKLDVSRNDIHWFPPSAGDLKLLTVLRADSSMIYLLPPEMNLLTNLKELYLSKNELSSSDGFENLESLEVLDLYQNQFITVPDFKGLPRLRALDFCQNFIDPPQLVVLEKAVVPYSNLRECLRTNYCQQAQRNCGAKDFPIIQEMDDERYSNFTDHTYSDGPELEEEDCLEPNKPSDPNSTTGSFPLPEMEVWEIDTDDNYDPNEVKTFQGADVIATVPQETEELVGQTSHEVRTHPHYFIPFWTVTPAMSPKQLDPPLEGQFDD